MTINDIVKETIKHLNESRTSLTPDNYLHAFCKIAQNNGFSIQECHKKERFINKLNPVMQEDISKYNINTLDELLTYLVSSLNRLSVSNGGKERLAINNLVKQLLRVMVRFPDKEVRELAISSLERIEYLKDLNSYELIIQKWEELLAGHKSNYLEQLQILSGSQSSDLTYLLQRISKKLNEDEKEETIKTLATLLVESLTPSLSQTLDEEIATIAYNAQNAPEVLASKKMQKEIRALIQKRIKADKEELKDRIVSLVEMLGAVSNKIINLIDQSNLSHERVKEIKTELLCVEHQGDGIDAVKQKLLKITSSLEEETKIISEMMHKEDELVQKMQQRIRKLEQALIKAKRESKLDFLTKLLSKRALEEELRRADKAYDRYGIIYSIIFFDIDHFKSINDTHGHEAGDLILRKVGELFLDIKRDVDIIGRYGGEEFLAILPNTPLEGAIAFAQKVCDTIEEYHFIYKGETIPVTISAGAASCVDFESQSELISSADKMLYKAKQNGRNQVFPQVVELL